MVSLFILILPGVCPIKFAAASLVICPRPTADDGSQPLEANVGPTLQFPMKSNHNPDLTSPITGYLHRCRDTFTSGSPWPIRIDRISFMLRRGN